MPIYLVRAGEYGPVKIGFSEDVCGRLAKMQADNPERLRLIRLLEGGFPEEHLLHVQFAPHWLRGEWFSFTRTMMTDIALPDITDPSELEEISGIANAEAIINALGGTQIVAKLLNVGCPAVSNWKVRGLPPGRLLAFRALAKQAGRPDITLETIRAACADNRPVAPRFEAA